jgi:hypothetical protein
MSAVLEKIIEEIRTLPPIELQMLRAELDKIEAEQRAFHISQVKGKYTHISTSSDGFAARKAEEIALEDRRSQEQ